MAVALIAAPTVTEQGTAGTTTMTVNYPATVAAGDFLILTVGSSGNATTTPSGWTALPGVGAFQTTNDALYGYYKLAAGTEGGTTFSVTLGSAGRATAIIARYSGVDTSTPIDVTGSLGQNTGSGSTCVVASQTTVTNNAFLVTAMVGNAATGITFTQPSGFTLEAQSTPGAGTAAGKGTAYADGVVVTPAGATGTKTWTWSGVNLAMNAFMVALRPSPPPLVLPAIPATAVFYDSFARTSSSGWGTSPSGHTYTGVGIGGTTLGTDFTIDASGAHHLVPAAVGYRLSYIPSTSLSISSVDLSATGTVTLSGGAPLGARVEMLGLAFRMTSTSRYYLARIEVGTDSKMTLGLLSWAGQGTYLAQVAGLFSNASYTSGQRISIRVQTLGARIRVKAWLTANAEPSTWDITTYDLAYVGAGGVGIRSGLASGNTNTKPVDFALQQFWAGSGFVAPQTNQPLMLVTKAAFGYSMNSDPSTWQWTDISRYARYSATITGGAQDQGAQADPLRIGVTLDNTDGQFTAKNPLSPFWPNVVRNVPLQVGLTWPGALDTYELGTGFVDGWPVQPNAGVLDVTVPLSATGRLRRMRRSSSVVISPLRRSIANDSATVAYWPMEDSSSAAVTGGARPLTIYGAPTWSTPSGLPGSSALPTYDASTAFTATVPTHTYALGQWQIDWYMKLGSAPTATPVTVLRVFTSGTCRVAEVAVSTAGLTITGYDASRNVINSTAWPTIPSAVNFQHYRLQFVTIGGTVSAFVSLAELDDFGPGSTGFTFSTPAGAPTIISLNSDASLVGTQAGHLSLSDVADHVTLNPAATGWTGETAPERVERVCGEAGIPVLAFSGIVPSQAMGPQPIATVPAILDECADLDNGLLHDAGPSGSLVYVSGALRYNAAAQISPDYLRNQIGDGLGATYDDQQLVTAWKIDGANGGTATYVSPMAADDIVQQGTVNPDDQAQLAPVAQWRTNLGAADVYRIPSIGYDLRRSPELAQAVLGLLMPAKFSPQNLPVPYPPSPGLDVFAEGFAVTVDAVTWQVAYNCSPADPWHIAEIEGAVNPLRLDSDTSTLSSSATLTATSLSVGSTGPLWTTTATFPADFPFDINIGGEQIRVTAITGSSSPQTFTVVRAVNGIAKAHTAGEVVSLWRPAVLAL